MLWGWRLKGYVLFIEAIIESCSWKLLFGKLLEIVRFQEFNYVL